MFFQGDQPIYMQLYEKLRKDITEGIYPYQSRFPSKRVIADRYGISLITVEHSMSLLCDEGYLEARERSGYFVIFRQNELFSPQPQNACVHAPLPPLSSGSDSDRAQDFPFSVYARTMRRVLSEYDAKLLSRVPNAGVPELREAIARYLARSRGFRISSQQIIIGSGSEYLYGLIVQLLGREEIYAIEKPSYEKIELVYRANGTIPEMLALGEDGILSSELQRSRAHILHITPYRSYPTGISTNASKRREYIRWADTRGGYIIEDDFESEFTSSTKPEETVFSLSEQGNVLYLNSFSKTISPSIRIAYLILPEKLVDSFTQKLGFYACTVPAFEQYVLAEFIEGGEFERHLNRVRRRLRNRENAVEN